jgi:hypothetical protein
MAIVAAIVVACDPIARGTTAPGSETLPGPGFFHLEGDPLVADRTLIFRSVGPDGVPSSVTDTIQPGERTVVDRTSLPGPRTLVVGDLSCIGTFTVMADREIDVVVRITSNSCEVAVERVHAPGAITH